MKTLLLASCLLIYSGLKAQTLQFSRVLMIDNSTAVAVPANHVWKVTSYWQAITTNSASANSTSCSSTSWHSPFLVNGQRYYQINGITTGSTGGPFMTVGNSFPLWLPAGATLQTLCTGDFLSIVEFTIIP
jgi:hypothetical protein